jgi:DNA polymerase III delta prime subunit
MDYNDMMTSRERSVSVDRVKLIAKLKENLEIHLKDYAEAKTGYRIKLKQDLENALANFDGSSHNELTKISVQNVPPRSYEKEYEEAIQMLEWSEDDKITLDNTLFKQYVQNEWTWTGQFDVMATTYKSFAAGAMR